MKVPAALRIAALMMFVASTSVADAQLSARTAHGGLFGWLVDWVPAGVEMTPDGPVMNGRATPFASSHVQLGSVRAADPNAAWMGYSGRQDRGMSDAISAERALRPIAEVYGLNGNRGQSLFADNSRPADSRRNGPPLDSRGNGPRVNVTAPVLTWDEGMAGLQGVESNALPPLGDVTIGSIELITTAPEPATYWMAAVGLAVIVLIRRIGLA